MNFLKTKTGLSIIALVAVFVFLYLYSGVFGGTILGVTLRTNPDLKNGLMGHWTFDGDSMDFGSSTAEVLDSSGNGYNGNWLFHASTTKPGVLGQAITFDGVNDRVDVPITVPTSNYTIAQWVKLDDVSTERGLSYSTDSCCTGNNNREVSLEWDGSKRVFTHRIWDGSQFRAYASTSPEANTWYHVTAVHDGSNIYIYVNGVLEDQTAVSPVSESHTYYVFGVSEIGGDYHLGSTDDARIYNRVLSDAEIKRLYELGATTKIGVTLDTNPDLKDGLVAHYTFDGSDIDWPTWQLELIDIAGGYDANLTGTAGCGSEEDVAVGKIGQAYDFGTSTEACTAAIDASGGQFNDTVHTNSAWIFPRTMGGTDFGTIFSNVNNATDNGFTLNLCSLDAQCSSFSNTFEYFQHTSGTEGAWHSPENSIKLNEWNHVAASYDGGSLSNDPILYINGEAVSVTESQTPTGAISNTNLNTARIGIYVGGYPYPFDGYIDDVRHYNRILSAGEVKRIYELGATTKIAQTISTNPDLERGLVGHWTFDGYPDTDFSSSTSEVKDISGNDNHGDWLNHATTTKPGKVGQALDYDGTDDSINAGSDSTVDDVNPRTFSTWLKLDSVVSGSFGARIIEKAVGCGSNGGWYFYINNSQELVYSQCYPGPNGRWDSVQTLEPNRWYHVVATHDNSSYTNKPRIFINGENAAYTEGSTPTGGAAQTEASGDLFIGAGDDSGTDSFPGILDDVRFYNRELSTSSIERLYQLGQ